MTFTRWSARFALAALVLSAAPALTMAPAGAAPADTASLGGTAVTTAVAAAAKPRKAKSWLSVKGPEAFSPNGDGRKDKARFKVKVKKRANVTVKVVRAGKVVRGTVKLGKRKAGSTKSWVWDGKNSKGKRVADVSANGRKGYQIKVAARSLKTGKRVVVRHDVTVDTKAGLPARARLVSNDDTVHPRTTVTRDRIWFSLKGAKALDEDVTGTLVIRTPEGRKLTRITSDAWNNQRWEGPAEVEWDGKRADGKKLGGGKYDGDVRVRLRTKDSAGNVAQTRPITVRVSSRRLEAKTVNVTVAPQQTRFVPSLRDCGPTSGSGCGETPPCGTVTPSTRPDMPLGFSYRAQECAAAPDSTGGRNHAVARHFLDLPADAVRGGEAVSVTMRGRSTVDGESDTARLTLGSTFVTSDASQNETSTTASQAHEYSRTGSFGVPTWTVETFDNNSYDVSQFDVTYTYLVLGD